MNKYIICFASLTILLVGCSQSIEKPKVHTVEIINMKFLPDDITINKGDTILWINRDIVAHDVTEEGGKGWTSSVIPSGESWKMEVTDTADYFCSIHIVMKGKIRLK